ncbi:hypothetical protein, partial [Escherichia coli]|uniref:hypothetical protein n=1 Tax=Escherichia coli TaxID=562 RepID=UPI001960F6F7
AKMPSLKIEVIDLIKIVNDTINIFINEKAEIILETDYQEALIEADKNQLSRMFINFIRNSIQANANRIVIKLKEKKIFLRSELKTMALVFLKKYKIKFLM